MYTNILSKEQLDLLPFIQSFKKEYYLVGGTAIALQIGHRQSIDFDLFKLNKVNKVKIKQSIELHDWKFQLLHTDTESFHILLNEVKITFFQYPFHVPTKLNATHFKMPDLLHLAAMKAYALGRRAKWKDYVDLYFILKNYHSLQEIADKTKEIFGDIFSFKLFRQQLCYFQDIDYTEEVFYLSGFETSEEEVKRFLTHISLS